jgi:DNA-binding CsgD family transcriptional regulator
MGCEEQILELVGSIYDAANDPSLWPTFLERLAQVIEGEGTVLFAVEPAAPLRTVSALTRFDPELIDRYLREFPDNIWVRRADERFTTYEVRYSQGLTSTHELQRDRYYADFLSPARVTHSLGLKIPYGSQFPAYLASSRFSTMPPFEDSEGRIFLTLGPHIRRALELHRRIGGNMAFSGLLDQLPVGVVFADQRCRPLWWNQYAGELLQARDGLWVDSMGLRTTLPAEGQNLEAVIRQAGLLGTQTMPGGGAMAISRPSMRRSYAVLVSPIRKGSGPLAQAAVAILITDPERSLPEGTEQRLALQFGLTPAEARVATRLVQGMTVEDAAAELSIGIATARTHVRNLLQKTGTTRQAELIRVLLSGPYLLDQP